MSRARILADYVSSGDELADKLSLSGGAMTGAITTNSTFDGVDVATRDATLTSTTTLATAAAPKANPAFTGTPTGINAAHLEAGVLPSDVTGGSGLTGVIPSKFASYATDAAATSAGYNVAGGTYFNTTNKVVKTYNGTYYKNVGTEAGDYAPTTFDILGDGSCITLHEFENGTGDSGGLYGGGGANLAYTTTYKKFGSYGLDVQGSGEYYDIAALPKFYACSIWYYENALDSGSNYIFDFRHDDPSNGRGYLYGNGSPGVISMSNDTTNTGAIGDVYVNGVKITSTYTYTSDTWHHIAISTLDPSTTAGDWNQGIRIGNRSDGTTQGSAGYFDKFRAFNRSLNESDVQVLYQEGL